jgi:ABC-type branched-subunit amino acid transport system ATPase component
MGMGKSTTINSICGMVHKYEGNINFNNVSLIGMPSYKIAQLGIGLVPEGRRAFLKLNSFRKFSCYCSRWRMVFTLRYIIYFQG